MMKSVKEKYKIQVEITGRKKKKIFIYETEKQCLIYEAYILIKK